MTGLTPPMREALDRLCHNKVWADGRSVNALIRRGLASEHGWIVDEPLFGTFRIVVATAAGREAWEAAK